MSGSSSPPPFALTFLPHASKNAGVRAAKTTMERLTPAPAPATDQQMGQLYELMTAIRKRNLEGDGDA